MSVFEQMVTDIDLRSLPTSDFVVEHSV